MIALGRKLRHRPPLRKIVGLVLTVLIVGAWFVWLRPTGLGGPLTMVRVTGHSMEPTMYTGDLALVHRDASYDVGEVVAFRIPGPVGAGPVVIHRVASITHGTMTMRGDNNDVDDSWAVEEADVVGQLWLHVPNAGHVVGRLADPVVLGALAASFTVFLVLMGNPRRPDVDSETDEPAPEQVGAS